MEFLVLWIATIIGSIFIDVFNCLSIIKDLADEGYKLNLDNIQEIKEQDSFPISKNLYIMYLIPFFNILMSFYNSIQIENARLTLFDQLRVIVGIEDLTKEELEEYQKNPTRLNAMLIPIKSKIKEEDTNSMISSIGTKDYKISFIMGKSLNDITIVKVTGTATELSEEEQKKLVVDDLRETVLAGIEKYGGLENFVDAIKETGNKNETINLNEEEQKNDTKNNGIDSISKQKHNLEYLRNKIIESKNSKEATEKGQSLTKKPVTIQT